jgi:D-sedoheptulose 7-phosphate isomerase
MNNGLLVKAYVSAQQNLLGKIDSTSFGVGIQMILDAFISGKKIITCGNGGSAHTASHFITDWQKMTNLATGKKFRGFSLADNMGLVTAFANDIEYSEIFSGQLKSILDEGDLLVAISGSGNSKNVLNAVEYANSCGGKSLAIVGYDGGELKKMAHHSVWVPSFDMQLCEDIHLMFGHMTMKALTGCEINQIGRSL